MTEAFDFSAVTPEDAATSFLDIDEPTVTPEEYDQPDSGMVTGEPLQTRRAKVYSGKVRRGVQKAWRITAVSESTVADSAALVMYGDDLARTWGNLADADARVAKAIDWITDGTENPYLAAITATIPLIAQVVRNHEPQLEPMPRGIRIPFTKRMKGGPKTLKLRVGIRLGRLHVITNDADALTHHVYTNPEVIAKVKKTGIRVAIRDKRERRAAAD